MMLNTTESDLINVTDSAAQKIYELIKEENNESLKLRVNIEGGGCSGFKYNFGFEEQSQDDDTIIEKQIANTSAKIQVLIDPMSYQYLLGSEIDYRESINEASFVIRNPKAKTTCGCGSSFNV